MTIMGTSSLLARAGATPEPQGLPEALLAVLTRGEAERRLRPHDDVVVRTDLGRREAIDHEVPEVRARGRVDPRNAAITDGLRDPRLDVGVARLEHDGIRQIAVLSAVRDVDARLGVLDV